MVRNHSPFYHEDVTTYLGHISRITYRICGNCYVTDEIDRVQQEEDASLTDQMPIYLMISHLQLKLKFDGNLFLV